MIRTLLTFAASLVLAVSATAQTLNSITPATNTVPANYTNSVTGTGWFVGGSRVCTIFGSVKPTLLVSTNAAGTGSTAFNVFGSPDPDPATATFYPTTNALVLVDNGTNTAKGYTVVDVSSFQCLAIGSIGNTGTNLVATNFDAGNLRYLVK